MKRERRAGRWKIWVGILCLAAGLVWTVPASVEAAGTGEELVAALLDDTSGAALEEAPSFQYFSSRSLSSGWDYGDQLSGNELQIYNTLESVTDMKEYYYESTSSKKGIQVELSQPYICSGTTETYTESSGYQKAQKEWNRATHAYIRDYGEKYWIYYFVIGMQYSVGNGCVTIHSLTLYPRDYYSEIRSECGITDETLNQAIQKIRGISGRYEKVKAAHDYVAELVTYNSAAPNATYGHTITGGLLEKYNHLGVCECYAKLFRLICEENGIPCILVTGGKSRDSSGNVIANHMWNYVQMEDGNWYVVDVTWDDQSNGISTSYFLSGYNSPGFNGKKVGEDHLPVGCFSSSVSYDAFVMPSMAAEKYVPQVEVTGITLDQTTMTIEEDGTSQLDVSGYLPENATMGKDVNYVSSDSLIASVDTSGKITGEKAGTAVITVSSREYPEVKAQCTVTVKAHVYGNPVTEKEATCLEDGVKRYTCTNAGCSAEKKEPIPAKGHSYGSWQTVTAATCESAEVQKRTCACGASETRSYGSAKGHTAGEWKVTKSATGSKAGVKEQYCSVCGKKIASESIARTKVTLNASSIPLQRKKSTTALKIKSYTTGDTVAQWTSDKPSIVTVNKKTGKLTAKKTGKAVITVTMKSGAKASCIVKVQSSAVKTTRITVPKSAVTLKVKQTYTIKATRTPITSQETVKFSSSNKKIATVSSKGKITAKKKGKATITVRSGKKYVKIKVTVK